VNKSSILLEAFVLLIVFPIGAFAYFPGDIVDIYTVSPCQYLTVGVNSYGLKFIDCNEVSPNIWHCDCVNNSFDLKAVILPDAPSIDYQISIEIFNPEDEKKEVKKVVPFSGGVVFYAQKTPTPAPSPSPSPTPIATPAPTTPTPHEEERGCGGGGASRICYDELVDLNKKFNSYKEACETQKMVLIKYIGKAELERSLWQIVSLLLAVLLVVCLFALFNASEENEETKKSEELEEVGKNGK